MVIALMKSLAFFNCGRHVHGRRLGAEFGELFFVWNSVKVDHFWPKTYISPPEIPVDLFLVSSHIASHPVTVLLEIHVLGWTKAWAVPTSNFWGTVHPIPLSLRPWARARACPQVYACASQQPMLYVNFINVIYCAAQETHRTKAKRTLIQDSVSSCLKVPLTTKPTGRLSV